MRFALPLVAACTLNSCVFVLNDMERAYETRNYSFDGNGIRLVEVRSYNGRVTLDHNSTSDGSVDCEVRFYASGKTEAMAQDRLVEMTAVGSRDGDVLRIEVPHHSKLGTNNAGARLDLNLPEGVLIDIRTSNDNVNVRALSGPIKIKTSDGRVDIENWAAPGTVEVKSPNGGIDYQGGSMDFELVTSNGPVYVALPDGWNRKGYLHSSNGSVRIESEGRIDAKMNASTSNGKVTVSSPSMEGEGKLTVGTSNGPVSVKHGG